MTHLIGIRDIEGTGLWYRKMGTRLEADGDVDDFTSPLTLGQIQCDLHCNRALRLRENTGAQERDYGKVKIDDNASGRIVDGGINLQDNIVVNVGTVNEKNADSFSFGTEAGIATGKVAGQDLGSASECSRSNECDSSASG